MKHPEGLIRTYSGTKLPKIVSKYHFCEECMKAESTALEKG